jgi:hypothetical protein
MKQQTKTFNLNGQPVRCLIKKSFKAKYLRISINRKGELSAVLPFYKSLRSIEKFVLEKSNWILKNLKKTKQNHKENPKLLDQGSRVDYLKYKHRAKRLVRDLIEEYNQFYQFSFNRICIKNQRSLWGSCSSQKNLNFNYRIIYLPPDLQAYLIVHELCHLKELNHSPRFWALVKKTIPNYSELRKRFRDI